jgi:transposase-like protein
MEPSTQIRYSMAFKQQVVEDLESGRFGSMLEAGRHYGIGGAETIRNWLRRLGRNHLMPKVVRVERPDEADQMAALRQQIRQLQQALGQTQLKSVLNETLLEMACEQLGLDVESFKKKAGTRPCIARIAKAGGR